MLFPELLYFQYELVCLWLELVFFEPIFDVSGSPLSTSSHINDLPICPEELKPVKGKTFEKLEEGLEFYKAYASHCGFVTRLEGEKRCKRDGGVKNKRIVCNKEGVSKSKAAIRNTVNTRVGCGARVDFSRRKLECGEVVYVVSNFIEKHNHAMHTPTTMVHLKPSRDLNFIHKKMIIDNSRVNQGAVRTYRMFKEYVRGYKNIGASMEDFKNFSRDVKRYLKEYDAQMLIETFMQKKAICPSFYFDFEVDEDQNLNRIFWADPISIKNYALFGDSTSFDTTFDYNRYKMVFAPFTGVDNHKRCVTFAAGLIARENADSFTWLFERYVEAMNGCYPLTIITDQCLGIKAGVEAVFNGKTQHRYCMWHIMKKLPEKVGAMVCKETTFLKDIMAVVWADDIDVAEFESRWASVVEKHDVSENEWLKQVYEMRASWIPAYFRGTFMGGIMRTTSRSESENSFFGNFTNPHLSLVEFWMRYQSAMDAQRWKSSKLTADAKNSNPYLITPLPIEQQASVFYTPPIFYEFQDELRAATFTCGFVETKKDNDIDSISIMDRDVKKVYVVECAMEKFQCSCKRFERVGVLCRHVLWILKDKGVDKIPREYLLDRWGKNPTCRASFNVTTTTLLKDCATVDNRQNKIGELWSEVFTSVSLVEDDEDRADELMQMLRSYNEKLIIEKHGKKKAKNRKEEIEMLIGSKIPNEATVLPPKQSKNKGSGKRLLSEREKAIEERNRPLRRCRACGEMATHDFRNCNARINGNGLLSACDTMDTEPIVEESARPLRLCRACGEKGNHDSRNCTKRKHSSSSSTPLPESTTSPPTTPPTTQEETGIKSNNEARMTRRGTRFG